MSFLNRFRSPRPTPVPPAPTVPVSAGPRESITIALVDLMHRLPAQHVAPGTHDLTQVVQFDIAELADRIARGQPSIRLAVIHQQLPGVFKREFKPANEMEIRFPWRRLLELVHAAERSTPQTGLSEPGAQQLARLLRRRRKDDAPKTPPATKSSIWRFTSPGQETEAGVERNVELRVSALGASATPANQSLPLVELETAIQELIDARNAANPVVNEEHRALIKSLDLAQKEIANLRGQLQEMQAENDALTLERDQLATDISHLRGRSS